MPSHSSDRDIYLNNLAERIQALPHDAYPALNAFVISQGLMIPPWWVRCIIWLLSKKFSKLTAYQLWSRVLSFNHNPKYASDRVRLNDDLTKQLVAHLSDDGFDNTELNKLEAGVATLERRHATMSN